MKSKILVIDDEQTFLETLKMVKWGAELEMIFCNNANEALTLIPFVDGIISDVCMVDGDKLEAALFNVQEKIPIVRMTGDLDYPATFFLAKPFTLKQFKESITKITETSKQLKPKDNL